MNTKKITTWIAAHKARTVLIALAVLVLTWDWFMIPRLIIMMLLPLVFLLIPVALILGPPALIIFFILKAARAKRAKNATGVVGAAVLAGQRMDSQPNYPANSDPIRTEDQQWQFPERFEGVDITDADADRH